MAVILLAERLGRRTLRDRLARVWFLLVLPLVGVTTLYALQGRGAVTFVCLGLALLYQLVEWLLDIRLKYPFRDRWSTHIPYILLEYAALFSLIRLAFEIGETSGWLVVAGFWLVMAGVVGLYVGRGSHDPTEGMR